MQQNTIHVEIFMTCNDQCTTSKQTTFPQLYFINHHFKFLHISAAITEATYCYFDYMCKKLSGLACIVQH